MHGPGAAWLRFQYHDPSSQGAQGQSEVGTRHKSPGSGIEVLSPVPRLTSGPRAAWLSYWNNTPCFKIVNLTQGQPTTYGLYYGSWLVVQINQDPRSRRNPCSCQLGLCVLFVHKLSQFAWKYLTGGSFLKIVYCNVLLIKICFTVRGDNYWLHRPVILAW